MQSVNWLLSHPGTPSSLHMTLLCQTRSPGFENDIPGLQIVADSYSPCCVQLPFFRPQLVLISFLPTNRSPHDGQTDFSLLRQHLVLLCLEYYLNHSSDVAMSDTLSHCDFPRTRLSPDGPATQEGDKTAECLTECCDILVHWGGKCAS